ncbi:MAG TPA: hypothetical protein VGB64_14335 [Actinomycetota bacterium]
MPDSTPKKPSTRKAKPGGGGRGRPRGKGRVGEAAPAYGYPYGPAQRVDALARTLGSNRLARVLGVSESQPSRWRSGHETPSESHHRAIADLDHIMERLHLVFAPATAMVWLESFNYTLNARPIDALTQGRYADVLTAVEVADQGGFD